MIYTQFRLIIIIIRIFQRFPIIMRVKYFKMADQNSFQTLPLENSR